MCQGYAKQMFNSIIEVFEVNVVSLETKLLHDKLLYFFMKLF